MADRVDGRVRIIKLRLAFKQALKEPLDPVSKNKRKEEKKESEPSCLCFSGNLRLLTYRVLVLSRQTEPK